jgi:hypothetical protein
MSLHTIPAYADQLRAEDPSLSSTLARKLAESIIRGTPFAYHHSVNPMHSADLFVDEMIEAVQENERMNMHNDDEDVVLADWTSAQSIIDIYDDAVDCDGDALDSDFPQFSAAEQAYVLETLGEWLASMKRA